jgi:hypothetical protein
MIDREGQLWSVDCHDIEIPPSLMLIISSTLLPSQLTKHEILKVSPRGMGVIDRVEGPSPEWETSMRGVYTRIA